MAQQRDWQEGYVIPVGGMNLDGSVRENPGLAPRNSDYVVRPDGPVASLPRNPVVSPIQRRSRKAAAAIDRPPTPTPCIAEDFDPSQAYAVPEHPRLVDRRRQYARSVAAPVESRSSITSASSRSSIIEKKKGSKQSIAQRKPTPHRLARAPQSVAAPIDSRSSLSSAASTSVSEEEEVSSNAARKILKKILRGDRDSPSLKKALKKLKKKARKGSKKVKKSSKTKKNRQEDSSSHRRRRVSSGKKSVRFGNTNSASRSGHVLPLDLARRHAELIERENAKCATKYNGYVDENWSGGYFDLTSSPEEPGFLIKVPVKVMVRALQIADPNSFHNAVFSQGHQTWVSNQLRQNSPLPEHYYQPSLAGGSRRSSAQRRGLQDDPRQYENLNRSGRGKN